MGSLLAIPLIVIAVVGFAVAALVARADPKRWDNRVFALMCFVDAAVESVRAAMVLDTGSLMSFAVQRTCLVGSYVVAYLTIEFAYSFPFNRRLPWKHRLAAVSGMAVSIALSYHPSTSAWFCFGASHLYFVPYFGVTLYLLTQNYRRLSGTVFSGIPLVMLAVAIRWFSGMATYLVAERISPNAFSVMAHLDATAAILVAYALTAYAILKYQLFRVRGVVAEVVIYGGFAVGALGVLSASVDLVLRYAETPVRLRAMMVALALIPIAMLALGRYLLPKIEERIICPLDPRRALMRGIVERTVHEVAGKLDPKEVLDLVRSAAEEITSGGRVSFLAGPGFPNAPLPELSREAGEGSVDRLAPGLAAYLLATDDLHLHRPHAHGLDGKARRELDSIPGELLVPFRSSGTINGAHSVEGGELDRSSVLTIVALADHVALKLENYALFSERLSLRAELEETRRLATLGSFATAIAHDIRTPLTSVQMNVQILRAKSKLDPDDMEYFDIALAELRRLNTHILELLDYAKPIQVKASSVDVREVVDDAARGIEPILAGRRLRVERSHANDLPPVLADPLRLRQVLFNLIENAAQASPEGASITVRSSRTDGGKVALEISDHGRGIDSEHLGKIFEPFFTTRADGTGLGLAIAQKLVRAHGGEILVRSALGRGSTFTVLLPTACAA